MSIERGDFTVGDIGVDIAITSNQDLTGRNIDFHFIKPGGATISRDATSINTYTATYTTIAGDLDLPGTWYVYLYDATTEFYYNEDGVNTFRVRPKPFVMAVTL